MSAAYTEILPSHVTDEPRTKDRLLSMADVSGAVRRGKTWIMEAARRGDFPNPTKIHGRLYWSAREIEAWIEERLAEREVG